MNKKMKEQNFLSCVAYYRNNEKELVPFLDALHTELNAYFVNFEIIIVNDDSKSCPEEAISKYLKKFDRGKEPLISVINMSFYQGVEQSMNAGVYLAIGDFVIVIDSLVVDYDSEMFIKAYNKSKAGYDIVVVAPASDRQMSSSLFYRIFNRFSDSNHKLSTETFRVLSRRAINRVNHLNKRVVYRKVAYAICGLKYTTVYYQSDSQKVKPTKEENRTRKNLAADSLIIYTNLAYRVCFLATMTMMMTALGVGIYTVGVFFLKKPVEGWTTTMLFLSAAFFILFAVLTFVVKYLSLILNMVYKNEEYVIESVNKLNREQ